MYSVSDLIQGMCPVQKNMYDVIEEGFNLYANITTTRSDSSRQDSGYFFSSGGYVWREYRYGGGYQNARIVAWHLSSPFFIARMPEKSSGE